MRFVATMVVVFLVAGVLVLARGRIEVALWHLLGVGTHEAFECPQDAVVVLGGGYDPELNRLNGESWLRVLKGVEVFKTCDARWLVMSGRTKSQPKERQAELMRDLAVRSGVPRDRILLETDSVNTREHPLFLVAAASFDAQSRLAVVSSPWHLRRAVMEFRRSFPNAAPVASYAFSPELARSLLAWLPQLKPLDLDTMLHEYGGIAWYGMRRLASLVGC